jgi:hypothetical protein
MMMRFKEDEDFNEDYNDDLLKSFELPPDAEQRRVVLQILDAGGNIEDIIFEIEDIYKYVKKIYERCPERG